MNNCTICSSKNLTEIYQAKALPLFQNKVYANQAEAQQQQSGRVLLMQCQSCGFIFNARFDNSLMNYDNNYQNEQNYSDSFITYLDSIIDFFVEQNLKDKKIIEIGCGKGFFLNRLKTKGFSSVMGFDPAYEGNNPDIIKDYFGEKYKALDADLIILRHVLEHIYKPHLFLQMLRDNVSSKTKIFIEVPDFNWIKTKGAFWDIYYEHCNYFEKEFLKSFFQESILNTVFGEQYMYVFADLHKLQQPKILSTLSAILFKQQLLNIYNFLDKHKPVVIWGGSSKGVTLLNLLDKNRNYVKYLVDISPKKQNLFIATTGHQIVDPAQLLKSNQTEHVIVTNGNYFTEIQSMFKDKDNIQLYLLEDFNNG